MCKIIACGLNLQIGLNKTTCTSSHEIYIKQHFLPYMEHADREFVCLSKTTSGFQCNKHNGFREFIKRRS